MNTAMNTRFYIHAESDVAEAMRISRQFALTLGFDRIASIYIATIASELASNLYIHAGGGVFEVSEDPDGKGIQITTYDTGPGIANIELALKDGYSTAGSLGCGLPGVKRLSDVFTIENQLPHGLKVCAIKYLHAAPVWKAFNKLRVNKPKN